MQLTELLARTNIAIDNTINVIFVSEPGQGKSEVCEQIAIDRNADFIMINANYLSPDMLTGLPVNNNGKAEFLPYGDLLKMFNASKETIVCIEEIGQASPMIQALLMNLIQARRINNIALSKHVKFIINTNDFNHGAGVSKVLEPLKGRCAIFKFSITAMDWLRWAIKKNCNKLIMFYVRTYPERLNQFSIKKEIENVPTPRNWTRLSTFINAGFTDIETIASCIGNSAAIDFKVFIDNYTKLTGVFAQIENDPSNAPIFNHDITTQMALSVAISENINKNNIENILKYLMRYSNKELVKFTLSVAESLHPEICNMGIYTRFKIAF